MMFEFHVGRWHGYRGRAILRIVRNSHVERPAWIWRPRSVPFHLWSAPWKVVLPEV